MAVTSDIDYLFFILIFLSILGAFLLILPKEIEIITGWDIGIISAQFFGVTAACTVITGIPCAIATITSALINIGLALGSSNPVIKSVIFIPITFILVYIAIKAGRGGG